MLDMCPVGGKIYLVVGTMSFHTAEVKQSGTRSKARNAEADVPLGKVVAAAGGLPYPTGEVGSVQIDTEHSASSDWTMGSTVTAGGESEDAEEVSAVACRVVRRDWAGLGTDVKFTENTPDYRGGQHFRKASSDDEDEEEVDAQDLMLTEDGSHLLLLGRCVGRRLFWIVRGALCITIRTWSDSVWFILQIVSSTQCRRYFHWLHDVAIVLL